MPVTESERHQLFNWFEEHMGEERAATMMNLVPPVDWSDIATNSRFDPRFDTIDRRFDTIDRRFEAIDSRFEAIDTRFEAIDTRFDALDSKFEGLDSKFEALENRIDAKVETVRSELLRTLGTWLFLSQAAVIAAISVVIALVALG
jgi:hypothetical protein